MHYIFFVLVAVVLFFITGLDETVIKPIKSECDKIENVITNTFTYGCPPENIIGKNEIMIITLLVNYFSLTNMAI